VKASVRLAAAETRTSSAATAIREVPKGKRLKKRKTKKERPFLTIGAPNKREGANIIIIFLPFQAHVFAVSCNFL